MTLIAVGSNVMCKKTLRISWKNLLTNSIYDVQECILDN